MANNADRIRELAQGPKSKPVKTGKPVIVAPPPPTVPRADWPEPPAEEAYYGLPGRIVRAMEPHTEADPVAMLVQLIIMYGNAVGRGPHWAVGGDRHYTNGFAVLVGPTGGGRKGTSAGMVRMVFDGVEDEWLNGRSAGGISSGEGLVWAVRDHITARERVNNGKGQPPSYEMVESDPGVVDKRLMLQEPEFAGVLKQTERQGNTASVVLRQLWDGLPVVQTLTKNNPAKTTGAHVSLVGHITPEELYRYVTATEMANGFLNRFLFVCVRRSKFLPDGGNVHDRVLIPLRCELANAVTFARTIGEVHRHSSAKALWHAVYPILNGERNGLSGAITARAAPHVSRLALLFALMDRSSDIRPKHLMAGLALWDYCERSTAFLFGDRTGNPVADDVRDLLQAAPGGLTRTELVAALGSHKFGDKLTAALVVLEKAGLARREKVATGGKPAEQWHATHSNANASPLMATARRTLAESTACDESDLNDESPDLDRFHSLDRTSPSKTAKPVDPWNDVAQMDTAMKAAGVKWAEVLKWLELPTSTLFLKVPEDERRRAYLHFTSRN